MKTLLKALFVLVTISLLILTSCDWGAKWDLRQAEKALKAADKAHAESWAEGPYRKAQRAFDEACELERGRKINEARDKALEAKEWAWEAERVAIARFEEMQAEHDRLNSKKY